MSKKISKTLGAICMVLLMAVCVVPTIKAEAAAKPKLARKKQLIEADFKNGVTSYNIYINNLAPNAKITKVKSSNKHVLEAYASKEKSAYSTPYIVCVVKRNGKAKVSFSVTQDKKTTNLSQTITVRKAANPFKAFKVGSTNLRGTYEEYGSAFLKIGKKKRKVQINMSKGYKIKNIYVRTWDAKAKTSKYTYYIGKTEYKDGKEVKVGPQTASKWSRNLQVTGNYTYLYVQYEYKQNGQTYTGGRGLYLYR